MTDKEIETTKGMCRRKLCPEALEIITSLQKDKEYYKRSRDECQDKIMFISKQCDNLQEENQQLKTEIERLQNNQVVHIDINEQFKKECEHEIKTAKVEGAKELAKRLKDYYIKNKRYDRPYAHTMISLLFGLIDDLVKEMVGEG